MTCLPGSSADAVRRRRRRECPIRHAGLDVQTDPGLSKPCCVGRRRRLTLPVLRESCAVQPETHGVHRRDELTDTTPIDGQIASLEDFLRRGVQPLLSARSHGLGQDHSAVPVTMVGSEGRTFGDWWYHHRGMCVCILAPMFAEGHTDHRGTRAAVTACPSSTRLGGLTGHRAVDRCGRRLRVCRSGGRASGRRRVSRVGVRDRSARSVGVPRVRFQRDHRLYRAAPGLGSRIGDRTTRPTRRGGTGATRRRAPSIPDRCRRNTAACNAGQPDGLLRG